MPCEARSKWNDSVSQMFERCVISGKMFSSTDLFSVDRLHTACLKGNVDCLDALLQGHPDLSVVDKSGQLPLNTSHLLMGEGWRLKCG